MSSTGSEVGKKPFITIGLRESAALSAAKFLRNEVHIQSPGVFDAKRIDGLVFELPGDNTWSMLVALHDASNEFSRGRDQRPIRGRLDACMLWEGSAQMVRWHEELWIAEDLQRANAEYDLHSRSFGGVDLPVQLVRIECSRFGFHPIPVGSQSNELKWDR